MDADRFDDVVRSLSAVPSRRRVLGLTLGGAVGPFLGLANAEAKKKKRKKKKKKCKGDTKKCGKKCIAATSCCTDASCGGGATCQGGTCDCPVGEQDCQGTCISDDDCCPACTGGQECEGGACVCPDDTFPCGNGCVPECCVDTDCADGYVCSSGFCNCFGTPCNQACCNFDEGEVCERPAQVCQGGGCPTTDYCTDPNVYSCSSVCDCVTSIDGQNVCVETAETDCIECASDAACVTALGQPAICIPTGEFCEFACPDVVTAFCIPLGCPDSPLSARSGAGRRREGRRKFARE